MQLLLVTSGCAAPAPAADSASCTVPCQKPLDAYRNLDAVPTLDENEAACADADTGTRCLSAGTCGDGTVLAAEDTLGLHFTYYYYAADGSLVAVAFVGDVIRVGYECVEGMATLDTLWGDIPACWPGCAG
jgi:hypothetical protein